MNDIVIFEKWKNEIALFSNKYEFQTLSELLMEREGFKNLKQRGKGGDGGRDIVGEKIEYQAGTQIFKKDCWFQCKNKNTEISWNDIIGDIHSANNDKVPYYYILSNQNLSSRTQDEIKKWNNNRENHTIVNDYYTGERYIRTLWRHEDLCKIYFPEEKIPQLSSEKEFKLTIEELRNLEKTYELEIPINFSKNKVNSVLDLISEFKKSISQISELEDFKRNKIFFYFSALALSQKQMLDAQNFIDSAIKIYPNNIDNLFLDATIKELQYDAPHAKARYNQILKQDPNNFLAKLGVANCFRKIGDYSNALIEIENALKISPDDILGIKLKSETLRLSNRIKEALDYLNTKQIIIEGNNFLKYELVSAYIDLLDFKNAHALCKKLYLNNKFSEYANSLGVIFYENAKRTDNPEWSIKLAIKYFNIATELDKNNEFAWSNLLLINLDLSNIKEYNKLEDYISGNGLSSPYIKYQEARKQVLDGIEKKDKKLIKKAIKLFDICIKKHFDWKFVWEKVNVLIYLKNYKEAGRILNNIYEKAKENYDWWNLNYILANYTRLEYPREYYKENAKKYKKEILSMLDESYD